MSLTLTQNQKGNIMNDEMTLDLTDLSFDDADVEVLSSEDARVLPEMGASFGNDFCCTICSSSSL